jgi:glycine/D-amino acid oxidase-like deaminating enzyme
MIYVIGSGPSGLSCTLALLEKGHRVTMLDGGGLLEPEKQKHLDELAKTPPAEWRGDKVRFLKAMAPDRLGVKLKLAYGSDFAFQGAQELARVEHRGADSRPSLAKGGLSNVWCSPTGPRTSATGL